MDKYAVWVKASERSPTTEAKYFCRDIQTGARMFIWSGGIHNGLEWLDEFPVHRGVEKAEDPIWLKELIDIRNKLKNDLPVGEENPYELIQYIKWHINDLDNFCSRIAKWAGNDAVEFAEWVEENYVRLYSEKLKGFAWVNCKENEVLVNGSDYHYTTLINKAGLTTEQLYKLYQSNKYGTLGR